MVKNFHDFLETELFYKEECKKCNSNNIHFRFHYTIPETWQLICNECKFEGETSFTVKDAVSFWNNRVKNE